MRHLVSRIAYPAIILTGLFLHRILVNLGFPPQTSAYISVTLGGAMIALLELRFPYEKSWLPKTSDVKNDLLFMIFVQGILPKLLAFSSVLFLLGNQSGHSSAFWPHDFSPYLQAALMVIAAEFFRYWLHRLAHEWYPLWRFHSVHHSPEKLYWFNVGRFHPLDKGLQFLFDAFPFIILSVSEEVLSIYFVFYALNGFFQHCNIHLRLGFLNYIISGPELHRWHHSLIIEEANTNYGNNLIIWDLLFGTRFLPEGREVIDLGLKNRNYPMGFFKQMQTPFIRGIDQA